MCGIVGVVSPAPTNVTPLLIEGLKRLEYRGYDSAGIATLSAKGILRRRRSEGKLSYLEEALLNDPIEGDTGIGHTRWVTMEGQPETMRTRTRRASQGIDRKYLRTRKKVVGAEGFEPPTKAL